MPMSPREQQTREDERKPQGWPGSVVHDPDDPGPEQIRHDEEQTERQAPPDASPGETGGR